MYPTVQVSLVNIESLIACIIKSMLGLSSWTDDLNETMLGLSWWTFVSESIYVRFIVVIK